jgi:tetratricopeptide (TPR) repeat protein
VIRDRLVQTCRRIVSWQLAGLLLTPLTAHAQSVAPDCAGQDATACGRQYFEAGTRDFEKGDFESAAKQFQAALSQRPHAIIRFNLALSFARLGRPSAALAELRQVQADPSADRELKERAAREQRSAEQALARVSFRLADPTREQVELDGSPVRLTGQQELTLEPGNHHVRVISNSSVVLDQELELAPGERVELRVGERSRRIDVVVVPPPPAPAPVSKPAAAEPRSYGLSPAWFYASIGATVAFTGLTVWSGLDTNHAYSNYQRDLPGLTQQQADERVDSGHVRELRTNLLLAGSLVCGAGTAVLGVWFVDFSGKRSAAVGFSPGQVALSGRF